MSEISATAASRNFADLLDAVEHGDETFTIVRRGRVVAQLGAPPRTGGAALKAALRVHPPDPEWIGDLRSVWDLLEPDHVRPAGGGDDR